MNELELMFLILTIILGLVVGSFLNVVIYRLPNNMSLAGPASHCPKCNHTISWYDNIPVLSYLILKGKCRNCHEVISPRYIMVELLNAGLWVLAFHHFKLTWIFLLTIITISIFITIIFIDLDKMIIPDSLNIGILLIGIIAVIFNINYGDSFKITLVDKFIGFSVGLIFLLIVMVIEKIFKKEVMGGGDIKLIGATGLLLGWQLVLLGIVIGSFIGVLIEIPLRLIKIKEENEPLPFGPYLVIGFLTSMFVGANLINWYLSLF